MLERFTGEARSVVTGAQDEARTLRHPQIGAEHLLLAMLASDGLGGEVLKARGISAEAVKRQLSGSDTPDSRLDPDALATFGIDLDEVRRVAERQFGPGALERNAAPMPSGHIPFGKEGKKVLALAVKEAVALRSNSINSAHLLLGIMREENGVGARLIRHSGADLSELRAEVRTKAGQRAA